MYPLSPWTVLCSFMLHLRRFIRSLNCIWLPSMTNVTMTQGSKVSHMENPLEIQYGRSHMFRYLAINKICLLFIEGMYTIRSILWITVHTGSGERHRQRKTFVWTTHSPKYQDFLFHSSCNVMVLLKWYGMLEKFSLPWGQRSHCWGRRTE